MQRATVKKPTKINIRIHQGCGSGSWKRKQWKWLNFCGSTLKKEAGSGGELRSIWLFEEPEAEAFFVKHGKGMWKRLNFCENGSTLKKEAGSESKLESD